MKVLNWKVTWVCFPKACGTMKPLLSCSVSLWTLLVFSALLKVKKRRLLFVYILRRIEPAGVVLFMTTGRFVWMMKVSFHHAGGSAPVAQVAAVLWGDLLLWSGVVGAITDYTYEKSLWKQLSTVTNQFHPRKVWCHGFLREEYSPLRVLIGFKFMSASN